MKPEKKQELLNKLKAVAKNEIKTTLVKTDAPLAVCASRIGGKPAVSSDFVWPTYTFKFSEYKGKAPSRSDEPVTLPLSFLAQFNLKDVAAFDEENLLPKTGVLSFFYELNTMQWGSDPKDAGSARVFYFPDESALSTAEFPDDLEDDNRFPEYALEFKKHVSLPGFYQYDEYVDFENDDDVDDEDEDAEENAFNECRVELGYEEDELEEEDKTKLLGFPDVIQNSMEEECEYATRGYDTGVGYPELTEGEKEEFEKAAKDWTLLFQMGTVDEEDFDLMFCDCGYIYFWIKKEDLQNCNFDKTWLILQCY